MRWLDAAIPDLFATIRSLICSSKVLIRMWGVGKSTAVCADNKTARRPAAGGARLLFLANLYGTDPLRNIWQAELRYMNFMNTKRSATNSFAPSSGTADFVSRLLTLMYVERSHLLFLLFVLRHLLFQKSAACLLPGFVLS